MAEPRPRRNYCVGGLFRSHATFDAWLPQRQPIRIEALDAMLYGLYSWQHAVSMKIPHKGSEEARNELPTLLEEAQSGRATIITRRGRPIAALVPLSQYQTGAKQQSLLNLEGAARGLWGKQSVGTIKKLRSEWNR
jgi:prevent-host-death family protein